MTPQSQAPLKAEVEASTQLERMAEVFNSEGYLIVRRLIPDSEIAALKDGFLGLIAAALAAPEVGQSTDGIYPDGLRNTSRSDVDIDAEYERLRKANPDAALAIRGMGKDLIEYHRFLANPELMRVVKALIGHERFQINYDQCLFRLDRPNEELFAFEWHQDYPYNMMSRKTVTAWIPLTTTTADMGPPSLVPGSHKQVYPVVLSQPDAQAKYSVQRSMRIAGIDHLSEQFEQEAIKLPDTNPGDAVFFHALVLHRSGNNRSNRNRWVFNPRYGDLLDPAIVGRNWASSRAKTPMAIEQLEPHFVVTE